MTVVVSGGVDEAQRIQLGISDLAVTMDEKSSRLLSYHNFADGHGDAPKVRTHADNHTFASYHCTVPTDADQQRGLFAAMNASNGDYSVITVFTCLTVCAFFRRFDVSQVNN